MVLSWKELVNCLKRLGFSGPYKTGKRSDHPWFMARGEDKLRLPNDHGTDIRDTLLKKLREQANLSKEECKMAL